MDMGERDQANCEKLVGKGILLMHNRAIARPPQKNQRKPDLSSNSDLTAYSSVNHSGLVSEQSDAITISSNEAPTNVIP
jgi:hypothetical protein